MSVINSIELLLRRRLLRDSFNRLRERMPADVPTIAVDIQEGIPVQLPALDQVARGWGNTYLDGVEAPGSELAISMLFDDSPDFDVFRSSMNEYRHSSGWEDLFPTISGVPKVMLGSISLALRFGKEFAQLRFTAPTTIQSLLFRDSTSVHRGFRAVLGPPEDGGVGLIDLGESGEMWLRSASTAITRRTPDGQVIASPRTIDDRARLYLDLEARERS